MAKKKKSKSKQNSYTQIINPIHHLERMIEKNDQENDKLQAKLMLLTILSVFLAFAGILLAIFYEH